MAIAISTRKPTTVIIMIIKNDNDVNNDKDYNILQDNIS